MGGALAAARRKEQHVGMAQRVWKDNALRLVFDTAAVRRRNPRVTARSRSAALGGALAAARNTE